MKGQSEPALAFLLSLRFGKGGAAQSHPTNMWSQNVLSVPFTVLAFAASLTPPCRKRFRERANRYRPIYLFRGFSAADWSTPMRLTSRFDGPYQPSNVFPIRPHRAALRDRDELTAFRGFVLAASASALVWGLGLTALWLMVWKK
jgi:hypothetical protein